MISRWLSILLLVLSVALIGTVVVWWTHGDDSSTATGEPRVVDAVQLSDFATSHRSPVYWLGPRPDRSYELTDSGSGPVYVRYLTGDAAAGDRRASFVTVATYPGGGVAALRRAAGGQRGASLGKTRDGAVLLIDPSSPDSAHLAYPGTDVQIEVYSPVRGEALRLAAKGEVQRVR